MHLHLHLHPDQKKKNRAKGYRVRGPRTLDPSVWAGLRFSLYHFDQVGNGRLRLVGCESDERSASAEPGVTPLERCCVLSSAIQDVG